MYFTYMTATEWHCCEDSDQFDHTQAPTKYRFLSNCEFYPFDSHLRDWQAGMYLQQKDDTQSSSD